MYVQAHGIYSNVRRAAMRRMLAAAASEDD
jgi:hypothetical protein